MHIADKGGIGLDGGGILCEGREGTKVKQIGGVSPLLWCDTTVSFFAAVILFVKKGSFLMLNSEQDFPEYCVKGKLK